MSKPMYRSESMSPNKRPTRLTSHSANDAWLDAFADAHTQHLSMLFLGFTMGYGSLLKLIGPFSPTVLLAGIGVGILSRSMSQGWKNAVHSMLGFAIFLAVFSFFPFAKGVWLNPKGALAAIVPMGKLILVLALMSHIPWILGVPLGCFVRTRLIKSKSPRDK